MNTLLKPKTTLPWVLDNADAICKCLEEGKIIEELIPFLIEPRFHNFSKGIEFAFEMEVSNHGWVLGKSDYDNGERAAFETEILESTLQSGKTGKWWGDGPYVNSIFYKVDTQYIGKTIYQVNLNFTPEAAKELGQNEESLFLVLKKKTAKSLTVEAVPAQYAHLFCPEWDNKHPDMLTWLEEWKQIAEWEEESGMSYFML
jgi:hypothetical protein